MQHVEPPTPEQPQSISDWGLSWIRTTVPVVWGFLLTFLATRLPDVYALMDNPAILAAVTGAAVLAWYSLMRWLEPRLPAWLTRLVLGSNRQPSYDNGRVVEGEALRQPPGLDAPPLPRQGDIL